MKGHGAYLFGIRWKLIENLSYVSLEEFNRDCGWTVVGWLEVVIGQGKIGFYPDADMWPDGTEGLEGLQEDILYWFRSLWEGLIAVKTGENYEIKLLNQNLMKLVLKPCENTEEVEVSLNRSRTQVILWETKKPTWLEEKVEWTESVPLKEFEREIYMSLKQFIEMISDVNPQLLRSRWLQELSEAVNKEAM